jgi:hypothetical protein
MQKTLSLGKIAAIAVAAAAVLLFATSVYAAPNSNSLNGNKLQCFSGTMDGGYNGDCTLIQNGAFLDNTDGDLDPNNNYSGVYIQNSNLDGKLLSDVNKLAFTYAASAGTTASGGSPRISIPIDENGDGTTEAYAFIDTLGCNDGSADNGTLDAINDPTCTVSYGSATYPNWAAFAAANPTYRIATDALTFIIADQPGDWTITNVQLGKGAAKAK